MNRILLPKWAQLIILLALFNANKVISQTSFPPEFALQPVTMWDGKQWSNGLPNAGTIAVFNADYSSTGIITAKKIEIKDGVKVTLNDGDLLKIENTLDRNNKSKIILNSGSGIMMKNNVGSNSTPPPPPSAFIRSNPHMYEYTNIFMSSPVTGMDIGGTYPSQPSHMISIYSGAGVYTQIPDTTLMVPGVGYIETTHNPSGAPYDTPAYIGDYEQIYLGAENITDVTVPLIANDLNLLGNPYGNYLDADSFILDADNTSTLSGTLYFWTHNTCAANIGNPGYYPFSSNDYAVYNVLGGVNAGRNTSTLYTAPNIRNNYDIPNGKIKFGTGFFVQAISSGSAKFKINSMTSFDNGAYDQFFKAGTPAPVANSVAVVPAKHRIWINLEKGNQSASNRPYRQTLIGYTTNYNAQNTVTNGATDRAYDTPVNPYLNTTIDVYSFAPSSNSKLTIQGRNENNFSASDFFQLGYSVTVAGDYTFTAINDGTMFSPSSPIKYYIQDTTLPAGSNTFTFPHTFTLAAGTNDTRFRVVFTNCVNNLSQINSNYVVAGPGLAHNWTVTNLSTNQTATFSTAGNSFYLINLPVSTVYSNPSTAPATFATFNTTYLVNYSYSGGNYSCFLTTPQGQPNVTCNQSNPVGITGTTISSTTVAGATGYCWKIRNLTTNAVATFQTTNNNFALNNIQNLSGYTVVGTSPFLTYGTNYEIEVAAAINGVCHTYSTPCTITVDRIISVNPAICGAVITKTQTINISGGESLMPGYEIELTNTITNTIAPIFQINYSPGSFNLSNPNIPAGFILPNTNYCIKVRAVNISGDGTLAFSQPCCFTTSNFAPRLNGFTEFNVIMSPNPFTTSFSLDIQSASDEPVKIKVYDMTGKLVDDLNIDYAVKNNLLIGNHYSSGIYNVFITQGENSEILRIIKK